MDKFAVRVFVYGKVQGVYYRAFAQNQARQVGLTGYTRNLSDGSVEAYAEGDRNLIERWLESLKTGPPGAGVDDVKVSWSENTGKYNDFSITH